MSNKLLQSTRKINLTAQISLLRAKIESQVHKYIFKNSTNLNLTMILSTLNTESSSPSNNFILIILQEKSSEQMKLEDDVHSLKRNLDACNKVIIIITLIENKTIATNNEVGEQNDLIMNLFHGFMSSIELEIYSTSIHLTARTIAKTIYEITFQTFTESQIMELNMFKRKIQETYIQMIEKELNTLLNMLQLIIGTTPSFDEIDVIPLPWIEIDTTEYSEIEKLTIELQVLLSNVNGLKRVLEALDSAVTGERNGENSPKVVITFATSLITLLELSISSDAVLSVSLDLFISSVVQSTQIPTDSEKTAILEFRRSTMSFLLIIVERIAIVQSEIILLIGSPIDIATLQVEFITDSGTIELADTEEPPVLQNPEEEAQYFENLFNEGVQNIQSLQTIILFVTSLVDQSFVGVENGETLSFEVLFDSVVLILIELAESNFDSVANIFASLEVEKISSITGITKESLMQLQSSLTIMVDISISTVASVSTVSQTLINNRGLLIEEVSAEQSFNEQVSALTFQLRRNRDNCAGMDNVGTEAEQLLENIRIEDDAPDDSSFSTLISKLSNITSIVFKDFEDSNIVSVSTEILTFIQSITITVINKKQFDFIKGLMMSIREIVIIYVSQISIVDQRKLRLDGSLTFGDDLEEADETDFELQVVNLKKQLKSVYVVADANEVSLSAIENLVESSEQETFEGDDTLSSEAFVRSAQELSAMCSEGILDTIRIQRTAIKLVRSKLRNVLTRGQKKSLKFILNSLVSFKMTFIEQITVWTQQYVAIAGEDISAATLQVSVVNTDPNSQSETMIAEDGDLSGGFAMGTKEFYIYRYTSTKIIINSVDMIIRSIKSVQSSNSSIQNNNVSVAYFVQLLSRFVIVSMTGDQNLTQNLAKEIIIASNQITTAPTDRAKFLLTSIMSSCGGFLLSLSSQIIIVSQNLVRISRTSIFLLDISFSILSETGELVSVSSGSSTEPNVESLEIKISTLKMSYQSIQNISLMVSNAIEFKLETGTEIRCDNLIVELTILITLLSQDPTSGDIYDIVQNLLTSKLSSPCSSVQVKQLIFISSTTTNYRIEILSEINQLTSMKLNKTESTVPPGTISPTSIQDMSAKYLYLVEQENAVGLVISSIETVNEENEARVTAVEFFEVIVRYFSLVSLNEISILTSEEMHWKIYAMSEGGVTPLSGRIKFLFKSFVFSLQVYLEIIRIQIKIIITIFSQNGISLPKTQV